MKYLVLLCVIILRVSCSSAQEFDTHWISIPQPDSTSHVWFRHTFLSDKRHQEAHITVATTGYIKLYVNEMNVGTAAFYPLRTYNDHRIVSMTFDVTGYLRNDTNVIALIYAPTCPHADNKQISVTYYGHTAQGTPFSHHSNANWLCRCANSMINEKGGETIDGRRHDPSWKSTRFAQALWLTAQPHRHGFPAPITAYSTYIPGISIAHRREAYYSEPADSGVEYEFGHGFRGWIRLTMRNAQKGQRILFDNNEYICSGTLDEQASPLFTISNHRRVFLRGDNKFKNEQITNIEAIETTATIHGGYDD